MHLRDFHCAPYDIRWRIPKDTLVYIIISYTIFTYSMFKPIPNTLAILSYLSNPCLILPVVLNIPIINMLGYYTLYACYTCYATVMLHVLPMIMMTMYTTLNHIIHSSDHMLTWNSIMTVNLIKIMVTMTMILNLIGYLPMILYVTLHTCIFILYLQIHSLSLDWYLYLSFFCTCWPLPSFFNTRCYTLYYHDSRLLLEIWIL
jgi:hypothetical protein